MGSTSPSRSRAPSSIEGDGFAVTRSVKYPDGVLQQTEETMRTAMILTLRTAMTLTLALASLAAPEAQAQVPFKGMLQGQETDLFQGNPPTQVLVDGDVTGMATQLGRFAMTYSVTVSLPAGTSTGSAELTA